MIDPAHRLPIVRQAQLLDVSRSSVYYLPQPTSEADLALMRRIDELHLELPFAGSRMLRDLLRNDGFDVGRKHVATLMRKMGIEALYRKPRTTRHHRAHPVFPYLLRKLTITRPNHVWAAVLTTCSPQARESLLEATSSESGLSAVRREARLDLYQISMPFDACVSIAFDAHRIETEIRRFAHNFVFPCA